MQVALYARVSGDKQAKENTIESQIEDIESRIAKDGFEITKELVFVDNGVTGTTLARPGLERLRECVFNGTVDKIYVHCPDRLARKYAHQVLLMEEFHNRGIQVIFIHQPPGDTPEGALLEQVQGIIAEYERTKILERTRRGKKHAAQRGDVSVMSAAPYGYRYVPKEAGHASFVVCDLEAEIVRQIFEWVGMEGKSISYVSRELSVQGVLTQTGKSMWNRSTVWGMLNNPAYKGVAAYGKTKTGPKRGRLRLAKGQPNCSKRSGSLYPVPEEEWTFVPVPAIVSEDLFDRAQEVLKQNKSRLRESSRGPRYLLQGLLVCQHCRYALYGSGHGTKYQYYRCSGTDAGRFGGEPLCDNPTVQIAQLDAVVWQEVEQLLHNPELIRSEYRRRLDTG
ncbi:MAG: recombinase family protein, partial [bacterium]|nr:recombinase family protein [bacterium]